MKLFAQGASRRVGVEMPWRPQSPRAARCVRRGCRPRLCAVGRQQLRGAQPLEFGLERRAVREFHDAEAARRQIEPGQTEAAFGAADAGQHVVASLLQQRLVGDGSRGDDTHHLALHRALGLAGVAALLANGDRLALAHQPRQVGIEGNYRHTGHGNRRPRGGAALSQCNIQQLRGAARIVIEHLVKIAHAVEQQHVRMLRLDAQVLLHHGGVILQGCRGAHP